MTAGILIGILFAALIGAILLCLRFFKEAKELSGRLSGIVDVDKELAKVQADLADAKRQKADFEEDDHRRREQLTRDFDAGKIKYEELNKEISLLEENLEDISFGLYKPHFTFEHPEEYKVALDRVRAEQKDMVRAGKAAVSAGPWRVNESFKEGERMIKQYTKVMLRAFNAECDAAVANVTWNNVSRMEERVRKSFEAINQLGTVMKLGVAAGYLKLKLDELRLAFEYEDRKHQEREEQRRNREEMREEERAQQEIEKTRQEAERSEAEYQKALNKARQEALQATGAQLQKLTDQISSFEAKLDEARKKKERAISRAQLTKSGFVYVISNIGSFGERTFKVGMTRRLEPMERVDELGDASVPFRFDLHAMLYSDNAPELESALHKYLAGREVNLVNLRREFYFDVDLEEIASFVKSRGLSAQFTKIPEAKEYRQSMALRAERAAAAQPKKPEKFSEPLFTKAASAQ